MGRRIRQKQPSEILISPHKRCQNVEQNEETGKENRGRGGILCLLSTNVPLSQIQGAHLHWVYREMADTVMSEAELLPSQQPQPPSMQPPIDHIPATLSHGGQFIQYNIFANFFEVTSKFKPPIILIGKGAYGIVCSALNSKMNEHVALKKIANAFDNKIDAKRTLREIKFLRHMDHENKTTLRSHLMIFHVKHWGFCKLCMLNPVKT